MKFSVGQIFLCMFIGHVSEQSTQMIPFDTNLWLKFYTRNKGLKRGHQWNVIHLSPKDIIPYQQMSSNNQYSIVCALNGLVRVQYLDLVKEGFPADFLDTEQPKIVIQEWYNVPAFQHALEDTKHKIFELEIVLFYEGDKRVPAMRKKIRAYPDMGHKWNKYECVLKKYGKGLRKIRFIRYGKYFLFGQHILISRCKE